MKEWQEKRQQQPSLRLVERERPHNKHAEQVVLGTLINFPEKIEEVLGTLRPEDFYIVRHRVLYEIMLEYYRKRGQGADFLVLAERLEKCEDIDASNLVELMSLSGEIWSPNLAQDVRLITGPATQNRIINASLELAQIGWNTTDPDEARAKAEKLLYDLTMESAPDSDFESAGDITAECLSDADRAHQMRGQIQGIPTKFDDLDLMWSGMQRSDLILLAGRPSMGKTALGMGIAYNAARCGFAVAVFSLEMGKKQLGNRLLSLVSRIPANRLRTGWIENDEMDRLGEAQKCISDLHLYIDDTSGSPISSIRSKLHRLKARIKRVPDLIVIDYLQLMEDEDTGGRGRSDNRVQEISRISRGLKAIAREFNVPVLALAQLSRAVEGRASKIPQLSDLRESGSLEQDADIVAFVYRDEYYDPQSERKGLADVVIAKHRNGPVGSVTLAFNGSLTRFDNIETTPSEED